MTLAEDLAREHTDIDQGIEAFTASLAGGDPAPDVLIRAMGALRRHIFFEEELLFPPLHETGLAPPLFVMRREHGEIWESMDALASGLASGVSPSALRDLLDRLVVQLQMHNAKEEAVVYPAIDEMVAAPTRDRLGAELAEVDMQEFWVCEAARP